MLVSSCNLKRFNVENSHPRGGQTQRMVYGNPWLVGLMNHLEIFRRLGGFVSLAKQWKLAGVHLECSGS